MCWTLVNYKVAVSDNLLGSSLVGFCSSWKNGFQTSSAVSNKPGRMSLRSFTGKLWRYLCCTAPISEFQAHFQKSTWHTMWSRGATTAERASVCLEASCHCYLVAGVCPLLCDLALAGLVWGMWDVCSSKGTLPLYCQSKGYHEIDQ